MLLNSIGIDRYAIVSVGNGKALKLNKVSKELFQIVLSDNSDHLDYYLVHQRTSKVMYTQ